MAASLIAVLTVSLFGFALGDEPAYNSLKQICCAGTTYSLSLGATQCCGSGAFDPGTQMCCNGAVVNRYQNGDTSMQMECCGQKAVLPAANKVCCAGEQVDAPSDGDSSSPYDYASALFGLLKFYGLGFAPIYGCCQFQAYNLLTQTCCDGNVAPINGAKTACCSGAGLYDPSVEACCNGRISPMPVGGTYKTYGCCDDVAYNPNIQICCSQDTAHPERSNGILKYKASVAPDCVNCEVKCCGATLYVTQEAICCNDRDLTKLDTPNVAKAKAFGNIYENSTAQCCYKGSKPGVVQNPDLQMCCSYSGVTDKTKLPAATVDTESRCCGDKPFHPNNQICCANEIVNSPSQMPMGCCNGRKYQIYQKLCCRGILYPRNGGKDSCCEIPRPS